LPNIGNLNPTDISSIPAYFEMHENKEISILSGESIPENITCKLNKLYDYIYLIYK